MKIVITGARGQLGHHLTKELAGHELFPLGHGELDITDLQQVLRVIRELRPDAVIHAAACVDVDYCEVHEEQAYLVNTLGTRYVALACREIGARLVYVSTDYVFDGRKNTPYCTRDLPNPINIYGRTKLGGEAEARRLVPEHYIVRTSLIFGDRGENFVRAVLRLANERDRLQMVGDQVGAPTYAKDLAGVIAKLVETPYYGLYQVSNAGAATRCEFARTILQFSGKEISVEPISIKELNRPAARPAYSVMSLRAIEHTLGITMRPYEEALQEFLAGVDLQ